MNVKKCIPVLLAAMSFLAACASGPADISDDITPAELVQRAQEASDRNRYSQAMAYYQVILERFPSNINMVCQADYEIAFIHYKQKKYDTARSEFNALLTRYDTPDEELLPTQFKKLAIRILAKMDNTGAKKRSTKPRS
ncbi:hypothetical protein FACS1894124_3080 [Spirochaetia bacterium]|nr:hypothetical protein FACS1894124_3080 [Spirochaetia bacterium]